jgi:hypothetical protein
MSIYSGASKSYETLAKPLSRGSAQLPMVPEQHTPLMLQVLSEP